MPDQEPSKTKQRNARIRVVLDTLANIPKGVLDRIAPKGLMTAVEINDATLALKKALIERTFGAESPHHTRLSSGQ